MAAQFIPLYVALVLGAVVSGAAAVYWAWRLREGDPITLLPAEPAEPDADPPSPLLPE